MTVGVAGAGPEGSNHPLGVDFKEPGRVPRWRALAGWLVVPHLIWLGLLMLGALVLAVGGWFAILATGRMPESWSDYLIGVLRYQWRLTCYLFAWMPEVPALAPVAGQVDPGDLAAVLYCHVPARRDRHSVGLRALLVAPHLALLALLAVPAAVATAVGWVSVLLAGRWPRRLLEAVFAYQQRQLRCLAYLLLVTDVPPPLLPAR